MSFISAFNRHQLTFSCLEDSIVSEKVVRFLDAYVNSLDLAALDFVVAQDWDEGRPAFESSVFLKLYLYGYFNGIRSSRRLEKECHRNVEVHWLLGNLRPNYHSISDFRKVNPAALKKVFTSCVLFLQDLDLIGGTVIAIDGTKIRASNSKKNKYNPKKIERSEYADFVENNAENYKANGKLYREGQEINEHIFGTLKRQWGYNHTNLRGLEKVNGEIALIMSVYNLKRAINLLGIPHVIAKLQPKK